MKFVFNPFTSNFDITASSPSDISGGTANTVAGFNASGVLESIPGFGLSTNTGGLNINLSQTPADTNATYVIQNFVNTITPTNDLVNLNYQAIQNYTYLVGPNDTASFLGINNGLNLGTGLHASNVLLTQTLDAGSGSSTDLTLINQYINVQSGHTNANGANLLNQSFTIDAGATVNGNILGINQLITINGDLNAQINQLGLSSVINSDMTPFGVNGIQVNDSINAPVQYVNGYYHNLQVNSGGSLVNGVTGLSAALNIASGGAVDNGYSAIQVAGTIASGASIASGHTSVNLGVNFNDGLTGNGINSVNISHNMATGANYVNGYTDNIQFQSGGVLVGGYTGVQSNPSFQSGSGANYITHFQAGGTLSAGSSVTNMSAFQVATQINEAMNSFTGLDVNPNGSGSISNVTGVSINLSNVTSVGRKVALNINDGIINGGVNIRTASNLGVDSVNIITPTITIDSGTPISNTTIFGHNLANLLFANDDFAAGPLGVSLGAVGYVGQIDVATGKTVDNISMAVSGAQFSGNGTTSNLVLYNALGSLAGTGTPIITNLYAFKDGGLLSALATNSWGLHISDAGAENFVKRLAINTASEKVSSGVELEVLGDVLIDTGDLTINALTDPGIVLNDTNGKIENLANNTGTNGEVLTLVSGAPAWAAAPSTPASTPVSTKTANYNMVDADSIIRVDSTGSAITITVQAAAAGNTNRTYTIVKVSNDYNVVTIAGGVSTTIDTIGESIQIVSDGSSWYVINRTIPNTIIDTSTQTIEGATTDPTKGTLAKDEAYRWRVGKYLYTQYTYNQTAGGSNGSGNYYFNVPSPLIVDTTFVATNFPSTSFASGNVGSGSIQANGTTASMVVQCTTGGDIVFQDPISGNNISDSFAQLGLATINYSAVWRVPIQGWKDGI